MTCERVRTVSEYARARSRQILAILELEKPLVRNKSFNREGGGAERLRYAAQ